MVNWTELPDLAAVGLLAGAFASVARRNQTLVSRIWLTGWLMIALHFAAFLFLNAPGVWGYLSIVVGLSALTWTGLLFMWASVPYRQESSSRIVLISLVAANTLYFALTAAPSPPGWALNVSACLFGILPLGIALATMKKFDRPLRWALIGLYCALSIFLLLVQHRPGNGLDYAQDAVLFTVYIGCCLHFWYAFRRATAGAFITILGFLAWASVFLVAPLMAAFLPSVTVEGEVWNLPKYVVAVGMILLLLEDQIKHNEHLALHDHLTGLPNRRHAMTRLALDWSESLRDGTPLACMMIDADGFKQVNDKHGHDAGDQVLRQLASHLRYCMRTDDVVCRLGGDEFLIICPRTTLEGALHAAESTRQAIAQLRVPTGDGVWLGSISVGVAVRTPDMQNPEDLIKEADQGVYIAKREGRNCVGCSLASA